MPSSEARVQCKINVQDVLFYGKRQCVLLQHVASTTSTGATENGTEQNSMQNTNILTD